MNCGILTFYFAQNYGAVLQAYALKTYITQMGHKAYIIKDCPKNLKMQYSINPLYGTATIRQVLRKCKAIPKRIRQYYLFEKFISRNFNEVPVHLDAIIFGSDQIWNEKITGKTFLYYGNFYKKCPIKVSYAASFGSNELTKFEEECSKKYLVDFRAVSLREKDTLQEVSLLTGKQVETVLDPVFLMNADFWNGFAQNSRKMLKKKYVLFYSLKEDPDLIIKTQELSNNINCDIVCIHPTCSDLHVGWKQLYDVGPYEFVSLIKNAEVIATNSFHAIAFSIIFGKRTLYKSFSSNDTRVQSLLNTFHYNYSNEASLYDFSKIDVDLIDNCIKKSKLFLEKALCNEMEKDR